MLDGDMLSHSQTSWNWIVCPDRKELGGQHDSVPYIHPYRCKFHSLVFLMEDPMPVGELLVQKSSRLREYAAEHDIAV